MGFVRLLHNWHYDWHEHRFQTLAFSNSSDDSGISIVDYGCAVDPKVSGSMCLHIDRFYKNFSQPIKVFWAVQLQELPAHHKIEQKRSVSGDDCHYNVVGLTDRQAAKYFRQQHVEARQCNTCDNADERALTIADLQEARDRFPPIGRPSQNK